MPINRPNVFSTGAATATDLKVDAMLGLLGTQWEIHTIGGTFSAAGNKTLPCAYDSFLGGANVAIAHVKSTSGDDSSGGTGARTIFISGLTTSGTIASESVSMNGATIVALANEYYHVNTMDIVTLGSAVVNQGDIQFCDITGTIVYQAARAFSGHLNVAGWGFATNTRCIVLDWAFWGAGAISDVEFAINLSPMAQTQLKYVVDYTGYVGPGRQYEYGNLSFGGGINTSSYRGGVASDEGGLVQLLVNPKNVGAAFHCIANILVYTPQ